ncbi:MAG: transglutaminase family protein [Planctomycetaceae bacterium]|nr:transglutaminase family protein [Planctomycetaceae bacterium]
MHISRRQIAIALVVALLLGAHTVRADEPTPNREETWQSLALRGQRIGYGHLIETRETRDGKAVIRTDMRVHTVMKRFDGKLTLIIEQQVSEDAAGNLQDFTFRLDNPPASHMEMTGRVVGQVLELQTVAGGKTTETKLPFEGELPSPVFVDRMLEESPLAKNESRVVSLFDPQLGAIASVKATGRGPAEFELPSGAKQRGTHAVVEFLSGIPGLSIDCYFDASGDSVLNESPLLGTTTWNVTREEALAEIPADIDIGLSALIRVSDFPRSPRPESITYRIALPDGIPDSLIPEAATQRVERVDDHTVDVTVASIRPQALPDESTAKATTDPTYLASTAMAKSDDDAIVRLAREAAPEDAASSVVAVALEKRVHTWLNRKNMSTNLATASEVVRSREGDCTEHAVLLTALLRARKIPARTVVGLVYWGEYSAFAGHAWAEAWLNGRWVPLDATQAQGGIGVDHIKLGDSSLADGDAGMIAASVSTWRLLDKAQIEIVSPAKESR